MCKLCIKYNTKIVIDGYGKQKHFNFFDIESRKDYLNIFEDIHGDIKERLTNLNKVEKRFNLLTSIFNKFKNSEKNFNNILNNWDFVLHESKWALGMTHYQEQVISISIHTLYHDTLELNLETLYHEIAHIFAPMQDHNEIWQQWAIYLGAKPRATCSNTVIKYRTEWIIMCENLCFTDYHDYKNEEYIKNSGVCCDFCKSNNVFGKLHYMKNPHFVIF